ncbi:MAG: peptidoglycan DD-metalloendopeptidase family protein [Pseudomonadota bacterium]
MMVLHRLYGMLLLALIAGCASTPQPAPVSDRTAPQEARSKPVEAKALVPAQSDTKGGDWRPENYVVKKGDTLYSIALEHGFDYKELAAWNELDDPGRILIGQQLRFTPPPEAASTAPLMMAPPVAGHPVAEAVDIKSQPKALKLPYSEKALAMAQSPQDIPKAAQPVQAKAIVTPQPVPTKPEARPDAKAEAVAAAEADDHIEWSWPARGKVLARFSENPNLKGVDIAGVAGQPVLASAAGKVVYSGSGIRGYGKLIVIKHSRSFSSVYSHNNEILVKEGQMVTKGQKIAEMGNTDTDQIKLHFEIRQLGRPVDPEKYLPGGAS